MRDAIYSLLGVTVFGAAIILIAAPFAFVAACAYIAARLVAM